MIYVDTSVALAHILAEDRCPPTSLWQESLVSSRLLEYEVWVRLNARGLGKMSGEAARDVLSRVAIIEMVPSVLQRALAPFPGPVRTLDALHLASADFLRSAGQDVRFFTYDDRQEVVAKLMKIPLFRP